MHIRQQETLPCLKSQKEDVSRPARCRTLDLCERELASVAASSLGSVLVAQCDLSQPRLDLAWNRVGLVDTSQEDLCHDTPYTVNRPRAFPHDSYLAIAVSHVGNVFLTLGHPFSSCQDFASNLALGGRLRFSIPRVVEGELKRGLGKHRYGYSASTLSLVQRSTLTAYQVIESKRQHTYVKADKFGRTQSCSVYRRLDQVVVRTNFGLATDVVEVQPVQTLLVA